MGRDFDITGGESDEFIFSHYSRTRLKKVRHWHGDKRKGKGGNEILLGLEGGWRE